MARAKKNNTEIIGNTYESNNYGDVILLEKNGSKVTLEFVDFNEVGEYDRNAFLFGSVRPKSLGKKSKYSVGTIHENKNDEKFEIVERNGKKLKVRFLE